MNFDEICIYVLKEFGESGLQRAAQQAVADIHLPETSKRYLVDVGLPSERILELSLSLKGQRLPQLAELSPLLACCIVQYPHAHSIGTDTGCAVCVDGSGVGTIFLVDLTGKDKVRFINSNVEFFGASLALYHEYCRVGPTVPKQDVDDFILKIESRMKDIDPTAIRSPENWWALILEQMKDGLL